MTDEVIVKEIIMFTPKQRDICFTYWWTGSWKLFLLKYNDQNYCSFIAYVFISTWLLTKTAICLNEQANESFPKD